jgi:ribonuclease G
MYNVDDAVAKVDGYIISVTDGGPHVGSKRLVRIEEAGRTAAVASLVDSGENGASGDDGVDSTSRRRGRRGGRRRSAAQAASSE